MASTGRADCGANADAKHKSIDKKQRAQHYRR
jgi:hypothetical protein